MASLIPRVLVFVAASTLAADFGFAQDKPDFFGSWILASGPSDADVPKVLSIQQPLVRANRRGEPVAPYFFAMTVARTLLTGTSSETFTIGAEGGAVPGTRNSAGIPAKTHWRVLWEEQSLVIEKGSYTGRVPQTGGWSERREVFSLTRDGGLRIEMTFSSLNGAGRTIVATYRRE